MHQIIEKNMIKKLIKSSNFPTKKKKKTLLGFMDGGCRPLKSKGLTNLYLMLYIHIYKEKKKKENRISYLTTLIGKKNAEKEVSAFSPER
jgi:hypothetical protein